MASVLTTNMASISAQRYLTTAQNKLQGNFEKLSSGFRINRAQDDAAGMGISQKLTASINATSMSIRNANDAIGIAQTAEGALTEVSSMLQRFKELATQGVNGALSANQRSYLSVEMGKLVEEINGIAARTSFNGNQLLDEDAELEFQTGPELTETAGKVTVKTVDITSGGVDGDLETATAAGFGSLWSLLGGQDGVSSYIYAEDAEDNPPGTGVLTGTAQFEALQSTIDNAISEIATQRAVFGTQVTQLNHNIANLTALHENLSAANSRVVDTDYAAETANLTKTQILQQAATAMLSQANAQPNVVLALLK